MTDFILLGLGLVAGFAAGVVLTVLYKDRVKAEVDKGLQHVKDEVTKLTGAEGIIDEVVTLLKSRGVNTYCIIVCDPDSDEVASEFVGNESEVHMQTTLIAERIVDRRMQGWRRRRGE